MLKNIMNENVFYQYLRTESIFNEKKVLLSSFIPEKILHREKEIQQISCVLAPILKGFKPNNLFIYGTCGTGKTICTRFVLNQLNEVGKNKHIKTMYINCKMKKVADTEYRLFTQFLRELGVCMPDTGLPTDVIIRQFFDVVEKEKQNLIIALDEIDALLKKIGDDFLYNLTRANTELKNSTISIIGITNDLSFRENLDPRIKSSLSEEEILFRPYNALELRDILYERIKNGFKEGVIDDFVLNKCAAMAAQEHGDARRALDLLRVAGEIAERNGDTRITEKHIDMAQEKIDLDRVVETIKNQPKQSQAVLYAIIILNDKIKEKKNGKWVDSRMLTGDIFEMYKNICNANGLNILTQRRVSDLINELDMLGIITANVVSKGRYGRTREISLALNENVLEKTRKLLFERFGM
ncbi:MAG: orc1/cdc6 family replication initiation protein [Candidatus Aenigmatarchaeota archaeon]